MTLVGAPMPLDRVNPPSDDRPICETALRRPYLRCELDLQECSAAARSHSLSERYRLKGAQTENSRSPQATSIQSQNADMR
jgi:hypothetical protein